MLVNRYGNKVKQELVTLASGNFNSNWEYLTINLNDDIANYRMLIVEYKRKDTKKGYFQIPVINGSIGERFNSTETESGSLRYIQMNVQNVKARSFEESLFSYVNKESYEPLTITVIYGIQ